MRHILSLLCLVALFTVHPRAAFGQKPTLFIVHSDTCPPCLNFDRVFTTRPEFRRALEDAYELRELDFDDREDNAIARQMGVNRVPSYVAYRGAKKLAIHVGWTMSSNDAEIDRAMVALCQSLNVEWPSRVRQAVKAPDPPKANAVTAASAVDVEARREITKLAIQTRQLQVAQESTREAVNTLRTDLQGMQSQFSNGQASLQQKLEDGQTSSSSNLQSVQSAIEQLRKSHEETTSSVSSMHTDLRKSIEQTMVETVRQLVQQRTPAVVEKPFPDISAKDLDSANGVATSSTPKMAGKWLSVLQTVGKAAVFVLAPEYAIPGTAALTAAGMALTWFRRRKASQQAAQAVQQQATQLGTELNPIRVSDASDVRTETKFVVKESDVLGESYAEAIRRVANNQRETNPGIVDVLAQVDGAARQLAHGKRVSRRPVNEPASETRP